MSNCKSLFRTISDQKRPEIYISSARYLSFAVGRLKTIPQDFIEYEIIKMKRKGEAVFLFLCAS